MRMNDDRLGMLSCPPTIQLQQPPSWCGCPATVNNTNENHSFCAVCLGKYDCSAKVPMGLHCGHTVCRRCAARLHPDSQAIPNAALLSFLEFPMIQLPPLEPDCGAIIYRLSDIALLLKANTSSRAIHRKVLNLICSLTFNGQNRICKAARAIGERVLTELCAACSHLSHYHAQQQLWGAIRSRACQFMGPATQEEALKLVLLALEDGSPLSRKVLVMFVVQRLAPQFPQASKTSIGHVIQLLYRASCFDVTKRLEASSLMTLRPEYRNYESLRREHDAQIVKIALECGIRFSPEQWSSILYGDSNHKPHMQSIIDKLQAPQTFLQMTTEFLVTIQRLSDSEDTNFFLSIHPKFQLLASIEILPDSPPLPWSYVNQIVEAVHCVLLGLFKFTGSKSKSSHNTLQQRRRSSQPLTMGATMTSRNSVSMAPPPLPLMPPPPPEQYFPSQQQLIPRAMPPPINGFPPLQYQQLRGPHPPPFGPPQCLGHGLPPQSASQSQPSSTEIKELLTESRILQARMKELQGKMPESLAMALEKEAYGLEEAVTQMVQRVTIH